MAADNPRLDELRRRVDKDPAAIAFAQLAEEYRRSGDAEEAVRVCRAGLVHHPNYVSARVTLGRALMELQQLDEAQAEFEQVLLVAPDNLVAVRSMAELYQLKGETPPDMSLAREVATHIGPPPIPAAAPVALAPPRIPDVPMPVVETPPVPVLETPAPVPDMIAAAPEAPPPLPDLPLQVEETGGFDADIALDLDSVLAGPEEEPTPPAPVAPPAPPEPPGLGLDAAVAAFNEAFGVPSAVSEPEPQPDPVQEEPELPVEPDFAFGAEPRAELEQGIDIDMELPPETVPDPIPQKDPFLADLEEWLAAIKADRDEPRIP